MEQNGTTTFQVTQRGLVTFPSIPVDPTGVTAGTVYFNTGTGKLKVYNGTAWRTITDS